MIRLKNLSLTPDEALLPLKEAAAQLNYEEILSLLPKT